LALDRLGLGREQAEPREQQRAQQERQAERDVDLLHGSPPLLRSVLRSILRSRTGGWISSPPALRSSSQTLSARPRRIRFWTMCEAEALPSVTVNQQPHSTPGA